MRLIETYWLTVQPTRAGFSPLIQAAEWRNVNGLLHFLAFGLTVPAWQALLVKRPNDVCGWTDGSMEGGSGELQRPYGVSEPASCLRPAGGADSVTKQAKTRLVGWLAALRLIIHCH